MPPPRQAHRRGPAADGRVREEERERAEREVHLAGERNRRDRGDREPRVPPLQRPEREGSSAAIGPSRWPPDVWSDR